MVSSVFGQYEISLGVCRPGELQSVCSPFVDQESQRVTQQLVIHGRYAGRTFIPNGPLPDAEGEAELVITPATPCPGRSIADAFGTAPVLRSGADILAQIRADRDEWGDR